MNEKSENKMKFDSLSAFMPVYNSENIVEQSVLKTYNFISKICGSFELVVVDDNSTDKTLEKLMRLKKKHKNLKIIAMKEGPTRRENLSKAMRKAKYNTVFFQDVDLSVGLDYIVPLISKIQNEKYDLVIGSRYTGIKPIQSLWRFFISKNYNLILNLFLRSKIKDHQCGFKAFRKEVLVKLLDEIGYDKSLRRGWFWDAELLIMAQKKGYIIKEMPVFWKAGKESTFNIRREIDMIPYVIKFMLR